MRRRAAGSIFARPVASAAIAAPILALGFLLLLTHAAFARQPEGEPIPATPAQLPPDQPAAITDVRFGWENAIIAERWCPIHVFILGGSRGFSGVLVTEFDQDATQAAHIITPVAATPGLTTPFEVVAALPPNCDHVSFTLYSDSGRRIHRVVCAQVPGRHELDFQPVRLHDRGLILSVGNNSLNSTIESVTAKPGPDPNALPPTDSRERIRVTPIVPPAPGPPPPPPPPPPTAADGSPGAGSPDAVASPDVATDDQPASDPTIPTTTTQSIIVSGVPIPSEATPQTPAQIADRRWKDLRLARADRGSLPFAWTAYDALNLLVIRAAPISDIDPRALSAIRAWVNAGGRLVLIADGPGPDWRRWFPDGPAGELITIDEIARTPLPPSLQASLSTDDANTPTEQPGLKPAATVQARPLHLTPRGIAHGWSIEWIIGSDTNASPSGLLAQGPVGFGWVTVLALDPQTCLPIFSKPALDQVWRAALDEPLADWLALSLDPDWMDYRYVQVSSGPTQAARVAIAGSLEHLAAGPALGGVVLIAVLVGMLSLTLLVGPVDGIVLRRRGLRQYSWLTALGWISLMSALAYILPTFARSSHSVVNRLAITDVVLSPDQSGVAAPDSIWSTALTGVFAGRSGRINLDPVQAGSWWRGASSDSGRPGARRSLAPLTTRIDTGGPGGQDLRGNTPAGIDQGQWTFRTLIDDEPGSSAISARVTPDRDSEGGWLVTLVGVPASAVISQADATIAGKESPLRWTSVSVPAGDPAQSPRIWHGRTIGGAPATDPSGAETSDISAGEEAPIIIGRGATTAHNADALGLLQPGMTRQAVISIPLLTQIPGSFERTAAIDARVRSGRWALVRVVIENLPGEFEATPDLRQSRSVLYRLLVPLDEADIQPRAAKRPSHP